MGAALFGDAVPMEVHVTARKEMIREKILSRRDFRNERPRIYQGTLIPGKSKLVFLAPEILPIIVKFLFGGTLMTCFEVSPLWFISFLDTIDHMMSFLDEDFRKKYAGYLELQFSRTNWDPLHINGPGLRIDRILVAKVLRGAAGYSMRIAHTYNYGTQSRWTNGFLHDSAKRNLETAYQIDITKGERHMWIHKDICRFHAEEFPVAATQNVTPVRVGDFVEIPVNLYNAFGVVSNVTWSGPTFTSAPLLRPCPLENSLDLIDWFDLDEYQTQSLERLQIPDFFSPQLQHESTEFSGDSSVVVSKSKLVAKDLGIVPHADRILGCRYEVYPSSSPIVIALKRLGLTHDRFTKTVLREGDVITLYISQGGQMM